MLAEMGRTDSAQHPLPTSGSAAAPCPPSPHAITFTHPDGRVEVMYDPLPHQLAFHTAHEPNVLMDVPDKHPGITHFALLCDDLDDATRRLADAGFPLSGGPVRFPTGDEAIFVRDPDRNVIELHRRRA